MITERLSILIINMYYQFNFNDNIALFSYIEGMSRTVRQYLSEKLHF